MDELTCTRSWYRANRQSAVSKLHPSGISASVSPPTKLGPTFTDFTDTQGPTRWLADTRAPCAATSVGERVVIAVSSEVGSARREGGRRVSASFDSSFHS